MSAGIGPHGWGGADGRPPSRRRPWRGRVGSWYSLLPRWSHSGNPMADLSEPEPPEAAEPPHLELFMTVIRVANWSTLIRWYIDALGLVPILLDAENEFALRAAGNGRLGVQGDKEARSAM